jgi:hypothetical protein
VPGLRLMMSLVLLHSTPLPTLIARAQQCLETYAGVASRPKSKVSKWGGQERTNVFLARL